MDFSVSKDLKQWHRFDRRLSLTDAEFTAICLFVGLLVDEHGFGEVELSSNELFLDLFERILKGGWYSPQWPEDYPSKER